MNASVNGWEMHPPSKSITPGKIIRFATDSRQDDEAGWLILFLDGQGGAFGCWRQGISGTWQAQQPRSQDEQAAFLARVKQAQEEAFLRQQLKEIVKILPDDAELYSLDVTNINFEEQYNGKK